MIEYYLFMHKGGESSYRDGVFPIPNPDLFVGIIAGDKMGPEGEGAVKTFREVLGSDINSSPLAEIEKELNRCLPENAEYMIFRISDTRIDSLRRGKCYGQIVKNGELKVLPNGVLNLEDEDRIICATEEFFSHIPDEAILSDSLFAESSQEWMEFMIQRISDVNWLAGKNLSAVTLIVRSSD